MPEKRRCFGSGKSSHYRDYHDFEWGFAQRDDRKLFEMLTLAGAQAGLSWDIVFKKRDDYKRVFFDYDVERVAQMTDDDVAVLCNDPSLIRNKGKLSSVVTNAKIICDIRHEYSSFHEYLWSFIDNKPIDNRWKSFKQIPTSTPLSEKVSKALKKKGMKFVGPTIMYAYMQSVGMINDHLVHCFTRSLVCQPVGTK